MERHQPSKLIAKTQLGTSDTFSGEKPSLVAGAGSNPVGT